jgi:hypothetical protein
MLYAVATGSGAIIYTHNFINIGSTVQMLVGRITDHREHDDLLKLISFLLNKERRLKI